MVKTEARNDGFECVDVSGDIREICNDCKAAERLHEYMKFRAAKEGLAYEFDPQFFRKHIGAGIRNFFGITVDSDTGTLIKDTKNPAAFKEWKSLMCEFTCFCDVIEAVDEAIVASPKRQKLATTIRAFKKDFPDDFFWASGPRAPAILRDLMMVIDCAADEEDDTEEDEDVKTLLGAE